MDHLGHPTSKEKIVRQKPYQFQQLFKQIIINQQGSSKMNFYLQISYDNEKTDSNAFNYTEAINQIDQEKPLKKEPKKNQQSKRRYLKDNLYNWNDTQNRRYISFLAKEGHLLSLPTEEKKRLRVNVLMSKRVKTRTSTQCHTHHQKMIEKYGNIENIIREYSFLIKKDQINCPVKAQSHLEYQQIIEIIEDDEPPKESMWKQYLLPELFSHEDEFNDNLFGY